MKRKAHPNAKLLTLRQAEDEFGLPYATWWGLVTEGLLPRLVLPNQRSIYVRRVDLERFIAEHMSEVAS
jgi:hypothetical protein